MNLLHRTLLAFLILVGVAGLTYASSRSLVSGPYQIMDPPTAGVTADTAFYSAPAYLQCIWFSQADAAPTAGAIDFYDNASAASGTKIFTHTFTTAVFMPFPFCPTTNLTNGLYIDVNMSDIVVTIAGKK